jgi:hypothetical protein
MIQGFSKNIACEPFAVKEDQDKGVHQVGKMQLRMVSQRTQLIALKVVYGSEENDIEPGDLVYVTQAGQNQVGMTSQWTKSIDIELDDGTTKSIVMVPLDQVQLVDRKRSSSYPDLNAV